MAGFWRIDPGENPGEREKRLAFRARDLAKKVLERLSFQYPNAHFNCQVDFDAGILKIAHILMPVKWAYVIKLPDIADENSFNRAVDKAGGELLERFHMPRDRYSQDKWREASNGRYRNIKHGFFDREINVHTGTVRTIIPTELQR